MEKNNWRIKIDKVILSLLLVFSFFLIQPIRILKNIFYRHSKLIEETNKKRISLGVLPVPKEWETLDQGKDTQWWVPKELFKNRNILKKGTPFRSGKLIFSRKDSVYKEMDFITINNDYIKQNIIITYKYNDNSFKFQYTNDTLNFRKEISPIEKDSIFQKWNFNYLKELR